MYRWIAILTLTVLVSTAQAQGPPGFGGFGFGRNTLSALAGVPEIQAELSVEDEQKQLLDALQKDLRDQRRALFRGGFRGAEGQNGRPGFEQMRERMQQLAKHGDELVAIILEEDQNERLAQLHLQREDTRALERPEVAEQLGLKQEQVAKIREIRRTTPRRGPQRRPNDEDLKRTRELIIKVLDDEQQAAWDKLKGEVFSFPERMSRGRRGLPFESEE